MKVLVVAHESEFIGGASRALFAILKYWKNSENIQFDVLVPDNQGDFVEALEKMNVDHYAIKYFKVFSELKGDYKDAFRKINVYRKDLYNYFAARKIGNKLVCNRYDAVYTNTRMSSMGSWIAQRLQIPHIIHIREFGNENTYWGPSNLKRINKTSNRVIVISKALAKEIEKAVEKSKMIVSYDGVIYQGKEKQKSDEYVDILLTGRITEAKSQEEAVMAIAELKKRGLSELVRLHFAGSVPANSKFAKQYYNRILDLIKKYNIEKQIIFHGEVSSMDLLRQNMDIELMCAERETFGWVTVEGMRSGLLVIGANTGATPEIITNMKTGLLYTHGDARDLADKIEWVLKNPSIADEIRKNGKKFSDESFTIEKNGTDVYRAIMACKLMRCRLYWNKMENAVKLFSGIKGILEYLIE